MSDTTDHGNRWARILPRPRSSQPGIFVCPHCLSGFFAPPIQEGSPNCRLCGRSRYDLRPALVRHHRCPGCGIWLLCEFERYDGGGGRPHCPRCLQGLPVSIATYEGAEWKTVVQVIDDRAGVDHPGPHVRTPVGTCMFCRVAM